MSEKEILFPVIEWNPDGAEGEEILVYKHETRNFNTGTKLIVRPSQVAIFLMDGYIGGVFGQGSRTLSTDNLPLLQKQFEKHFSDRKSIFPCEVYFVNKIFLNDLKWGTGEPIPMDDPIEQVEVHVRASGYFGATIAFQDEDGNKNIDGARKFLERVVGTRARYTKAEFRDYLRAQLIQRVKDMLGKALFFQKISILQISAFITPLSEELKKQLFPEFLNFGITLTNFSFNSITPLDEDLQIVREAKLARRKAVLEAEANAAKMDLESGAMARKREREGYTYQQEHSYDVLKAAAQNEGTSSTFLGAGMGLGMGFGVGGAFGAGMSNMAQAMDVGQNGNGGQAAQVCANCGAKLPAGAKFCTSCGKEVLPPDTVVCPKCNAKLPKGAKFCFTCGNKMVNTCVKCGKELPAGAKFCNECGAPQE